MRQFDFGKGLQLSVAKFRSVPASFSPEPFTKIGNTQTRILTPTDELIVLARAPDKKKSKVGAGVVGTLPEQNAYLKRAEKQNSSAVAEKLSSRGQNSSSEAEKPT